MSIHIVCPNGHKLKIKSKYAGHSGKCPMCGSQIVIPAEDVESVQSSLLAESLLMVNPPEADCPPAAVDEVVKTCARCFTNLPGDMFVCPE